MFEPAVAKIGEVRPSADPVQGYCDMLHHRFRLASAEGRDIPNEEALSSWIESGFPGYPLDA